jgi:hypothetical protein
VLKQHVLCKCFHAMKLFVIVIEVPILSSTAACACALVRALVGALDEFLSTLPSFRWLFGQLSALQAGKVAIEGQLVKGCGQSRQTKPIARGLGPNPPGWGGLRPAVHAYSGVKEAARQAHPLDLTNPDFLPYSVHLTSCRPRFLSGPAGSRHRVRILDFGVNQIFTCESKLCEYFC